MSVTTLLRSSALCRGLSSSLALSLLVPLLAGSCGDGEPPAAPTAVQRNAADDAGQALAQSQQLLGQGRPDMALPMLQEAVARHPLNARLRVNLGLAHLQLGQSEQALTILAEAEKLDPTLLMAPFNRAAACLELGRHEEALEHVDRALALSVVFAPAHMVRARILLALDRDAEAREAGEQALVYDPNMALAHEVLGEVAHRAGDDGTARAQYVRAAQLATADPRPWPGIARFAIATGDLEMAGKAVESLERIRPRDPALPALREELERARNP